MGYSAIKSLLDMSLYINLMAKKGDILLIDEPEQNLRPAHIRKMLRLFVRLIKMGVKVFVTTHSDYLIKELNNRGIPIFTVQFHSYSTDIFPID